MHEIDVTLTDYFLTIICFVFAWRLKNKTWQDDSIKEVWLLFFVSIGIASLTGGTVHGFFPDETSPGYKLLWPTTMLSIGITAACVWILAGTLWKGPQALKAWRRFALILFIIYGLIVLLVAQNFLTVIINYAPPMLFWLIMTLSKYLAQRKKELAYIALGLSISFFAAYVQQARLALHTEYLTHNATYHLLQSLGLWFIFRGAYKLS